LIIWNHQ